MRKKRGYGRVSGMRAECALHCNNRHGEGIFWSAAHGLLYWTDIFGECVWTYNPATDRSASHPVPGKVCCFATREGRLWNEVVAAFADGFAFLDLVSGQRTEISAVEAELANTRLNDGRVDRQGRFVVGGMDEGGKGPLSAVYRLDPDLSVSRLFGEVGCANGTCFSPDGMTMWFADSFRGSIERFNYDVRTGVPSDRQTIGATAAPGVPDGSCVDRDGFIWNAVWEGYRVERWNPEGRVSAVVEVPVRKPTCCAFGGPGLDTLFITSSRLGETDDDLAREPLAGCLFTVKPGVTGIAENAFAG